MPLHPAIFILVLDLNRDMLTIHILGQGDDCPFYLPNFFLRSLIIYHHVSGQHVMFAIQRPNVSVMGRLDLINSQAPRPMPKSKPR